MANFDYRLREPNPKLPQILVVAVVSEETFQGQHHVSIKHSLIFSLQSQFDY